MIAPYGIRPKSTIGSRMLPLAQALTQRGHRVSIVAPPLHNLEDAGSYVLYDSVSVAHTSRPALSGPAGVMQQVWMLFRAALTHAPDILHVFKPKGYSGLVALLAHTVASHLPIIIDTDDWEGRGGWNDLLPYSPAAKALFNWQERDLPRRAHAVTVASRTLETQVWGFGVPPERVVYLPNGISVAESGVHRSWSVVDDNTARRPTVLLYTRFWEFDMRYLVAALVGILSRRPDARLLVVGRGERGEERELLRLAGRAGVGHTIEYVGWSEPAQIPSYFAVSDVALFPIADQLITRAKCSAKLLEMMAAGLAIVAGRVGQVTEYIEHGQSGLLVAPDDPGALAHATVQLLDDRSLRRRLGAGAQSRVAQHYTWERLAPLAERAYAVAHITHAARVR
jgi:glycosyltransferase involved in cell wall biosynthesis